MSNEENQATPKSKKCRACGKEFVPAMYKQSAEYCSDPECQKAKLRRSREYAKNKKDGTPDAKVGRGRKSGSNSGRVCAKCGKDPYPNYFYCPVCHKSIQLDEEYDDILSE
jgi:uncharacterized OB-fold protein